MTTWPVLANWTGPIVMIGFGSIGRGTLPLILRHINCDRARVTVIDPDASWSQLAEDQGVRFVKEAITRQNYKTVLKPMLTAGPGPAFLVNLSVDVDSLAIMRLARETGALYIDTVIEPWAGFYYNTRLSHGDRSNYMLREGLLALKKELGPGTTAVSCCGANPGMVSWFVKQALIDIAAATKLKTCRAQQPRRLGEADEAAGRQGHPHRRARHAARQDAEALRHLHQHLVGGRLHFGRSAAGRTRLGHA